MPVRRQVTKAILPVAGLGTRFLPATKAMPKEMLTVVHKPIIQYAVEEALDACGVPEGESALIDLMKRHRGELPPVRFDCGTEDPLLEDNRALRAALVAEGIPHEYEDSPGGQEWPYWRARVADSLRFFAAAL
jgi:acetyl esterase/lipase